MFVFPTCLTFVTFWYFMNYLKNIKLGSSTIGQIGKTVFAAEFLALGNTLLFYSIRNILAEKLELSWC